MQAVYIPIVFHNSDTRNLRSRLGYRHRMADNEWPPISSSEVTKSISSIRPVPDAPPRTIKPSTRPSASTPPSQRCGNSPACKTTTITHKQDSTRNGPVPDVRATPPSKQWSPSAPRRRQTTTQSRSPCGMPAANSSPSSANHSSSPIPSGRCIPSFCPTNARI